MVECGCRGDANPVHNLEGLAVADWLANGHQSDKNFRSCEGRTVVEKGLLECITWGSKVVSRNNFALASVMVDAYFRRLGWPIDFGDSGSDLLVFMAGQERICLSQLGATSSLYITQILYFLETLSLGSPFVTRLDSQLHGIPMRTISISAHCPIVVQWHKPQHVMKMNVDGFHRSNSNLAGIGGVICSKFGKVVHGFYKSVNSQNNFIAEVMVLLEGLKICAARNWKLEAIETDSLQLQRAITNPWQSPWIMDSMIKQIKILVHQGARSITHSHISRG
ncbi:hypothetical protein ACH5RR_026083 [Cinchona calisaya]|uniref:RNase H type-1 domain-containing protein n=1 Tax=Cinchona calisaya TaxID=153742 RepID=A0ABD2Z1I1_9GENT